ncbi:MAG: hypothetical protein HYW57_04460 [Ignavibacteriales bacterium]|nr:hypothetical protein [Ignavibacteriales bacterium]
MPEKPDKIRVALISGAAIGAVWAIPGLNLINCCCCAGVILGGVLAVYLYKQEFHPDTPPMESSDAAVLGIMTGIAAAVVATTLNLLISFLFGDVTAEFAMSLLDGIFEKMESEGTLPPETVDQLRSEIEQSLAQSKTAIGVLMDLITNLIVNPLFATLGALIGYSMFKPKRTIGDVPQPQG